MWPSRLAGSGDPDVQAADENKTQDDIKLYFADNLSDDGFVRKEEQNGG